MKLTRVEVIHIAKLARLALSEEEIEKFQTQLSGILAYVGKLHEVKTDGVVATAQVTGLANVLREDGLLPPDQQLAEPADLLASSPLPLENNQIKVKNVF